MSHPSDLLFARMREVVEAPGYHLLQHYKQDFYKYDRQQLLETYTPEMTYLWVVREMGTHLFPLYIDPRVTNEAKAALCIQSGAQELYLLGPNGLKRIDRSRALDELDRFDYKVTSNSVMKMGRVMATIDTRLVWNKSRLHGEVAYDSQLPIISLTARDRVALLRIALGQVISQSDSLFTPCKVVTFNRINLIPEMHAQEEESAA